MRRVLREMDAEEFGWWAALYRADPWGEERADLRTGTLCALVANALSSKQRRYVPKDFMPDFSRVRPKRESPEEIKRKFFAIARAVNAAQGNGGSR